MKLQLLEPTPERRQRLSTVGLTPRALLARWAWLAYAVLKFCILGVLVGFAYLFAFGAVSMAVGLEGAAGGALFILGFIPVGKLFAAWVLPVRY